MIVASCLSHALDIGDAVVRGNFLAPGDAQRLTELGRERIGHWEITSDVPDDVWERWLRGNINGPIVTGELVHGSRDRAELDGWCYARTRVRVNAVPTAAAEPGTARPVRSFSTAGVRSAPQGMG